MGSQSIFRCTYRLLITIMDREDRDLVRPRTHTASLESQWDVMQSRSRSSLGLCEVLRLIALSHI